MPGGKLQVTFLCDFPHVDIWFKSSFVAIVSIWIPLAASMVWLRDKGTQESKVIPVRHLLNRASFFLQAVRSLPAGSGVPIFLDSGVRRGTDVLKALALGTPKHSSVALLNTLNVSPYPDQIPAPVVNG